MSGKNRWRTCRIMITREDKSRVDVECRRLGPLAVHSTLKGDGRGLFAVTHVGTGLLVCILARRADAERIVEYLLSKVSAVEITSPYREYVRNSFPVSIVEWLRDCRKQHAWVEPPQIPCRSDAHRYRNRREVRSPAIRGMHET